MSQNIESPIPVSNLGGGFDRIQIDVLQAIRDHGGKAIILAIPFFYELLDANITVAAAPTATPRIPTPDGTARAVPTVIELFHRTQTAAARTPIPAVTPTLLPTVPDSTVNLGQTLDDLVLPFVVTAIVGGGIFAYLKLRGQNSNSIDAEGSKPDITPQTTQPSQWTKSVIWFSAFAGSTEHNFVSYLNETGYKPNPNSDIRNLYKQACFLMFKRGIGFESFIKRLTNVETEMAYQMQRTSQHEHRLNKGEMALALLQKQFTEHDVTIDTLQKLVDFLHVDQPPINSPAS